ncbi:unnamed protein product [Closterium sp. NIES-54]
MASRYKHLLCRRIQHEIRLHSPYDLSFNLLLSSCCPVSSSPCPFILPLHARPLHLITRSARYCVQMETSAFAGRTADFLYMLMINTLSLLLIALIIPFKIFFLSEPLLLSVIYLWSRENPNGVVNFMGLLSMPAFYLPWAYLFMDLLFGMSVVDSLAGIVAGHIYYFLTAVYPRTGGAQLIRTPLWV